MLLRPPVLLPGLVFFLATMAIAIFAYPVVRGLTGRIERLQTTETDGYLAKGRFMCERLIKSAADPPRGSGPLPGPTADLGHCNSF
jgi:hypothetical protein